MKIVIACGNPGPDLDAIFSVLQGAGVEPAKAVNNASRTAIDTWHERLLARYGDVPGQAIGNLGKAWEHAASEIFLANWDLPVWGWADGRSTWLLDFWRDFDPQTRFVLVHTSPERALGRAIADAGGATFDARRIIADWLAYNAEMLGFYNRNRGRCLMVDAEDALQHPDCFIQAAADLMGVGLNGESTPVPAAAPLDNPLASLLAKELLQGFPEAEALRQEIEATLFRCGPGQSAAKAEGKDSNPLAVAITQLRSLIHSAGPVLEELRQEHAQLRDENEAQRKALGEAELRLHSLEVDCASQTELANERQSQIEALASQQENLLGSLEQARKELESLAADHQARLKALEKEALTLSQARDEQSKQAQERLNQLEASNKRLQDAAAQQAEESKKNEQVQQELRQENELLLLQLHQVQEELEQYFVKYQDVQRLADEHAEVRANKRKLLKDYQAQIDALAKAQDEQAKGAAEARKQLESVTKQRAEQEKLAADRQARIAALEKEKADLAKARDDQGKLAQDRQAQVDSITKVRDEQTKSAAEARKQLEGVTKQKAEQEKLAADRQTQLEAANKRLQEAEAQRAESSKKSAQAEQELRQENELLLLQLHQVQEELEHYFLQHQDLQNKSREQQARWDRILARHPDFCDWESIEPVAIDDAQAGPAIRWRIKGLMAGNRVVPDFEVTTAVRNGNPALIFRRTQDGSSVPFLRWPDSADSKAELQLQPRGLEADRPQRWATLWSLAATDWQFVRTLCSALVDFLQTASLPDGEQPNPDSAFWIPQLKGFKEQLALLPNTWRYDQVQLKREQVNPDYEHLWFAMDNAQFGDRRWPRFEFRLGAAMVKPGGFSIHPKLEFPQADNGPKQFEKWFSECQDDHGPKFELRFELKSQAMDMGAWHALSPTDQAQLLSMVSRLPALLMTLENQGSRIARTWKDWQGLAGGVINVMRTRLAQGTARPAVAAPAATPAATPAVRPAPKGSRTRKATANTVE